MLMDSMRDIPKHNDVTKWKHFPRYWSFVRGIQRSPVNSLHKDQWRGALVFYLICAWTNGWANNRDAGNLRRHRAHYDVIVMTSYAVHGLEKLCTVTKQYPISRTQDLHKLYTHIYAPVNWVHDDVIKWKYIPRYWPFVRGIHRSLMNSPPKGQWREPLMLSLMCAWIYDWVNNGEAGDLRRHRAHYNVTVMHH